MEVTVIGSSTGKLLKEKKTTGAGMTFHFRRHCAWAESTTLTGAPQRGTGSPGTAWPAPGATWTSWPHTCPQGWRGLP